jgi:hypothetical protein
MASLAFGLFIKITSELLEHEVSGVDRHPDCFREGTNSLAHGDGRGFDGIGVGHTHGAYFDHSFVCSALLRRLHNFCLHRAPGGSLVVGIPTR